MDLNGNKSMTRLYSPSLSSSTNQYRTLHINQSVALSAALFLTWSIDWHIIVMNFERTKVLWPFHKIDFVQIWIKQTNKQNSICNTFSRFVFMHVDMFVYFIGCQTKNIMNIYINCQLYLYKIPMIKNWINKCFGLILVLFLFWVAAHLVTLENRFKLV